MIEQEEQQQDYIVTARKWRPQRFMDVVGQDHVSTTLRNAVLTGRIHHAYMFNGPRGVGKTTSARVLAKAVNCENLSATAEPCGVCQSCVDIVAGRSLDVVEIDGASNNSVEDIRTLRENAKYPPITGKYKMYIIDEVHMLSTSAFNALLKILEEPPKHLLFVFATTEPHKVPATILSRCQRFDFRRMQIEEIARHLRTIAKAEGIQADEESLLTIAKKGDGSMRDSQSIFDQAVAFCGMNLQYQHVNEALNLIDTEFFFTISRAIYTHDVGQMLSIARDVFMRGYDMQECLLGLAEHFRNILTIKATSTTDLIELAQSQKALYASEAEHFTQADVLRLLSIVMTTEKELRSSPQPRLRFEFALVQMAQLDSAIVVGDLIHELRQLKKKIDAGGIVQSSGVAQANGTAQSAPMPAKSTQAVAKNAQIEAKSAQVSKPTRTSVQESSPIYQGDRQPSNDQQSAMPSSPPKEQARVVPAHELQSHWERFLAVTDVPASIKQFIISDLLTPRFADNQLILKPMQSFLADSVAEFLPAFTKVAQSYWGREITVRVEGANNVDTHSSFGKSSFGTNNITKNSSVQSKMAMPTASILQGEVAPTIGNNEADTDTTTISHGFANKAEHPLDNAIITHFNAVEISLR